MGTMGVPPSVFISIPVSVCTSNSGFFLMKNSGLPQPAHSSQAQNQHHSTLCRESAEQER